MTMPHRPVKPSPALRTDHADPAGRRLYYSADGLTSWRANESFRHPSEKPVDGGVGGSVTELHQRMQTLLRNNISCVVRNLSGRRVRPKPSCT